MFFILKLKRYIRIQASPGRGFNDDAIREMANSIREFGILQPITVSKVEKETPTGIDVEYQLIAGERRLRAAKLLGLRVIPAIIRNVDLEREKLELAVIENLQRENLNAVEMARAFQRLQEEFRMTQREIAAKLGKSRETVANTVRLLDLPEYIQDALQKGNISESHARLFLAVENPAAQRQLFDDIAEHGLTTRDVQERVKRFGGGGSGPSRPAVARRDGSESAAGDACATGRAFIVLGRAGADPERRGFRKDNHLVLFAGGIGKYSEEAWERKKVDPEDQMRR